MTEKDEHENVYLCPHCGLPIIVEGAIYYLKVKTFWRLQLHKGEKK